MTTLSDYWDFFQSAGVELPGGYELCEEVASCAEMFLEAGDGSRPVPTVAALAICRLQAFKFIYDRKLDVQTPRKEWTSWMELLIKSVNALARGDDAALIAMAKECCK